MTDEQTKLVCITALMIAAIGATMYLGNPGPMGLESKAPQQ